MTRITREPQRAIVEQGSEAHPEARVGLVYVPCAICRAPVDLAVVTAFEQPQLCERHLFPDFLPLQ